MNPRCRSFTLLYSMTMVIVGSGCSWDSIQQTGYETAESIRLKQCLDRIDSDCSAERTRYQDYQAELDKLEEEAH